MTYASIGGEPPGIVPHDISEVEKKFIPIRCDKKISGFTFLCEV